MVTPDVVVVVIMVSIVCFNTPAFFCQSMLYNGVLSSSFCDQSSWIDVLLLAVVVNDFFFVVMTSSLPWGWVFRLNADFFTLCRWLFTLNVG